MSQSACSYNRTGVVEEQFFQFCYKALDCFILRALYDFLANVGVLQWAAEKLRGISISATV